MGQALNNATTMVDQAYRQLDAVVGAVDSCDKRLADAEKTK